MKHQETRYYLSLPIRDMAELLSYSTDVWGTFHTGADGKIGSIDSSEIPYLAQSFIIGCMRALTGGELVYRAGDRRVTADVDSLQTYEILREAFDQNEQVLESINHAMKAFEALANPALVDELESESITAARTLVSYLDKHAAQLAAQEWAQRKRM